MKLKAQYSHTENKIMFVMDEEEYNSERTITKSQRIVICNHIFINILNFIIQMITTIFYLLRLARLNVYLVQGKHVLQTQFVISTLI